MRKDLSKLLDECVAWIREGEPIEVCLARYPHMRHKLEPLLHTALSISSTPKIVPSDEFRKQSKARLMSRLRESPVQTTKSSAGILETLANSIKPWRRFAMPATAVLFVALAGLLVVYSISALMPENTVLVTQSTLSVLSGNAEVQMPDSDDWQAAENGMIVEAGSRLKTNAGSRVLLTFFEGSTIELEPGTEIMVERIEQAEETGTEIILRQWLGKTWSRVVKQVDPGSRYEIHTPSAYALVRGTLFETDVDDEGLTIVRTFDGMVTVGAQDEEVDVAAGQQVNVEAGMTPSQPAPIPPADNELVVTVGMPAVGSVTNPAWSSTGYLPSGLSFNQIPGSSSSSPNDGDQVIKIPQPLAGVYRIALRYVADGNSNVHIEGLSEGRTIFEQTGAYEIAVDSEWLITVELKLENGQISSISVGDAEPLLDRGPENLVTPQGTKASIVPIDKSNRQGTSADGRKTYTLTVGSNSGGSVITPGTGEFIYKAGTVVEMIAEPNRGYSFVNWMGDVADPLLSKTTITMNEDQVVDARFARGAHVLTIISVGEGSVVEPGKGVFTYYTGAVVNLIAEPAEGWEFESWTGNVANPLSPITTITMGHPEVVTANFVPRK